MSGRCGHNNVTCLYLHGPAEISGGLWSGCECDVHRKDAAALKCRDCGEWLPMGYSDETPERVAIEIMAAGIVADLDSFGCTDGDTQTCPGCGWADYDTDDVPPTPQREAGWLARVITAHKETP